MTDSKLPAYDVEELLAQRAWLRRLACAIVGDSLADDVVQETWAAALASPPRDEVRLRAWLGRVARNSALRHLLRQRRRSEREVESAREEALSPPEELIARIEEQHVVARTVAGLDEPYRSTLLWHYYDDLSVSEIAARTGRPESTVRTHVQRGLQRVRERLDARQGSEWRLAILPLLKAGPTTAAGGGALSLASLGGLLMTTQTKLIAGGLTLIAAVFLLLQLRGNEPQRSGDIARLEPETTELVRVPELSPAKTVEPDERVAIGGSPEAPPTAAPTTLQARLRGIVLDTTGRPMAGVPLLSRETIGDNPEARGPHSPRSPGAPLSPGAVSRPPAVQTIGVSDAEGGFELALPTSEHAISAGEGYVTLYSGLAHPESDPAVELFLVAAPAVSLSGRVVRADGSPLPAVQVSFQWWSLANFPRGLDSVRANALPHTSTDGDGQFALPNCPGARDLELYFRLSGFGEETLRCPPVDAHDLLVTLEPHHGASEGFRAVVVDEGGAALPGAFVSFGGIEVISDEQGEVRMPWTRRTATLVAVQHGKAPYVRERFGHEVWEAEGAPDPVEIELRGEGLRISGRVFDAQGRAAPDVPVTVEYGTFVRGRDFAEVLALRGEDAGTLEMARTDEDGRFALQGLVDREYVVSAYDAETLACVRSTVDAGSEGVELRFPANGVLHDVDAVCVDTDGAALAGLSVGLMLQVTYGPDGQLTRTELATTDEEGRFHLEQLPIGNAWVTFKGPQVLDSFLEVTSEDVAGGDVLRFVLQRSARLRFLPSGLDPEGCQAGLVSENGTLVSLWVRAENKSMFHLTWDLSDGASPIFNARSGDYTLFVHRDGKTVRSEEIHVGSGEVNDFAVP